MPELLSRLRAYFLCQLAKRDVFTADCAAAKGDVVQSTKLLAKADTRLKKASGLKTWPMHQDLDTPRR